MTEAELRSLEAVIPREVVRKHARVLRGRDIYEKSRAEHAEIYQSTERAINKWIRKGLENGEPPPLDDPEAMISWWGKNMVQRVPDRLLEAARKAKVANPPSVPHGASLDSESGSADSAGGQSGDPEELDTGFLASLLRVRRDEALAHRRWQEALKEEPVDEGNVRVLQRIWQDLAEHLRALEKAAPDVLRKTGDMWLSVDIIEELAKIHGPIVNGVYSLWRRFAVKIGIPATPEQDRKWQEEVDRLFAALNASKFRYYE